ncbi:Serine/threonine-protein kinase [Coemansia biformis]|uniref:non-specific serine/threonine protein kinase n=1 Tax=Coemansia biformis TaxID=1286918 RepID=A0A9W8CXN1_9FUNG|nr:Serine/threonine-protein kinase [Coemansia biformis]
MADTAAPTSEPALRREHLPRLQPQRPLRPAAPGPHVEPRPSVCGSEYSIIGPHPGAAAPVPARGGTPGAAAPPDIARSRGPAEAYQAGDPRPGPRTSAGDNSNSSSSNGSRRMVGPYQLAKTIGAGSMGKVKVALDTRTNKRVAAKIIPLQQPGAPIYFPTGLDTTAATAAAAGGSGPIDACVEPWLSWLAPLALESHPDVASAAGVSVRVQRKVRLLQPRERYTTKDRERRENKDIRIVREVAINRLLHHPNICMLHDVVVHPNHYYIFQELVSGGQMLDYIISHGRLKEKHARKFARQIASAINYCHHNSIVHRDLKIENILISASGNIKLIDFGLSNLYSPRSQLSTFCGSLYFAAPELLNAQPYTGPEVDLWSFGVVLYVLVCGKVPFDDQSMPALHAKIKRGHVEYPAWLSPECRHLLSRLLVVAPQRRATMAEAVRHPWMCKGYADHPLVNSHLPVRAPLVAAAQIDRAVVREMARYIGFGFGSEEEIRVGLEAILTEDWYRAWLKDRLAPHLATLRTQLCAQPAASQPDDPQARDAVSATDLSSGTTLTAPAEPPSRDVAAAAAAGTLDPVSGDAAPALAARASRTLRPARSSSADAPLPAELERKRSSFWKRSSTFISGGLARASHRAAPDAGAPGPQPALTASASTEKYHTGQLRMRIFNDGKHTPGTGGSTAREYSAQSLSTHAPRMYLDPASGMVGIWSDGRLAPPDVDCAAIQQEYHDLVATDPLLSIYFLVKERREREARRALHPLPQAGRDGAHRLHNSLGQHAQPLAHTSVSEGPADSSEAWIKLVRVPEKRPAPGPSNAPPQAAQIDTQAPTVSTDASLTCEPAASAQLFAPRPGRARTSDDAVDQTTAAIEALSLRPRPHVSGPLAPATHSAGMQPPSADISGSRKKRSSIFKRFSVIVKGARPGSKLSGADPHSASRIVQAEGSEAGYMEISVRNSRGGDDGDEAGGPATDVAGDKQPSSTQQQKQQQNISPLHLISPESIGARIRGTKSVQKYTTLDSIEESKEYAAARAHGAAGRPTLAAAGPASDGRGVPERPAAMSPGRQYLDKPLCAEDRPANETLANGARGTPPTSAHGSASVLVEDVPPGAAAGDESAGEEPEALEHPRPVPANEGICSSKDTDNASSIFASTDMEDGRPADSPGIDRSPSEKAALLEKARREIEGFDEQEGVGLLDQTPELSYRVAGHFGRPGLDTSKSRARSASNTVVRMLTDIVRDAGGDANGSGAVGGGSNAGQRTDRGVQHHPGFGSQSRGRKTASPPVPGASRGAQAARTIPRHSSTGAINRAGRQGAFGRSPPTESPAVDAGAGPSLGFQRPDILRSHSHTVPHPQHTLTRSGPGSGAPEPPSRPGLLPANALGIEPVKEAPGLLVDSKIADSKSEGRSGARGAGSGSGGDGSDGNSSGSDIAGLDSSLDQVSPVAGEGVDGAENDIMDGISSAPPRADEYLKPVFLKGLFSVATTSTRSPTVIRANLLRVLGEMPLRFHEGKGYFTCSMTTASGPANIQEGLLGPYVHCDPAASHNSSLHKQKRPLRLPGVDRAISFRRKSKRLDEAALVPAVPSDKPHGPPDDASSNEGNASDSRQSGTESAGALTTGRRQPSLQRGSGGNAICFQIFLVRMPLLGLHGLQFRRVSGPAWRYKDTCSEILKKLKL